RDRRLSPDRRSSGYSRRCYARASACSRVCSWRDALLAERHGEFYCLDDLHVAGATADIAAERLQDLLIARIGVSPQQSGRGHDESGRAVAALRAELLVEAALHGGELPFVAERFDGIDALALDGRCERQAGERRFVVDQDRAGAAFAAVAAGLGAGEADLFAQVIEQQNIVGDRVGAVAPVQPA